MLREEKPNALVQTESQAGFMRLPRGGVLLCSLALAFGAAWAITSWAQSRMGKGARAQQAEALPPEPERAAATSNQRNSSQMSEESEDKNKMSAPVSFYKALESALKERGLRLVEVCDLTDPVGRRIMEDYGAVFVAAESILPPPVCIFSSEAEVIRFQTEAKFRAAVLGGTRIELQPAAMDALLAAREEARREGLDITPRGGEEAARRSYQDTVRLWNTRFLPALSYWMKRGRLTKEQVARLKSLSLTEQVREVLELEADGIYFSKDFSKSILYSIAAPGTSQHIMMLALDVDQFMDGRVRRILARHGWFQTVKSDLPHFTYLGLEERELPSRGLRQVTSGSQLFWIPNVEGASPQ
ncbi:MAG TPA: hypothetical protein VJS44_03625 [Pyrinomonadaceae bacterium]|nr:hypothetical protein [Pyrinomonadaceae bacterium]